MPLVPLDSLTILAIVDNELDPISPAPPVVKASGGLGTIAVTKGKTILDRGGKDGLPPVKEVSMEQICCAAHGLSLMIVRSKS